MDNRTDINQMKGEYAGLEMRKTGDPDTDFWSAMNEDNAKRWYDGGGGIFSDSYARKRGHDLGWDMISNPGPLNPNYGKSYKIPKEEATPKAKPTTTSDKGAGKLTPSVKKDYMKKGTLKEGDTEGYGYKVSKTPLNNREVRKMKRAARKEDNARIKAKRKEGTLDSSDFAQQPYRTLKGKF